MLMLTDLIPSLGEADCPLLVSGMARATEFSLAEVQIGVVNVWPV
jgi:hypothetical protein